MTGRYSGRLALLLALIGSVAACADPDPAPTAVATIDDTTTTSTVGQNNPVTTTEGVTGVQMVRVTDGDTLVVRLASGAEETVRLVGVNTPEQGECLADEATTSLTRLLDDGLVRLEADTTDRDHYGRLLRYVFAGDTFVNAELVAAGLAVSRPYEPDTGRQGEFDAAQQQARADSRGQWAPDACGPATGDPLRVVAVQADAPGDDNQNLNGEWVVVANTGDRPVDLTGWGLRDESASHRYAFPDGFDLPAGGQVRVHTGCGADTATDLHWCEQGSAVWNNTRDTAFLVDSRGNTVDSFSKNEKNGDGTYLLEWTWEGKYGRRWYVVDRISVEGSQFECREDAMESAGHAGCVSHACASAMKL